MGKMLNIEESTISPKDDALFFNALSGGGNGVFKKGNSMTCQIVSSTEINILDGFIQVQGRNYCIYPGDVDSVAIENGTQGLKRNDLIVFEFSKNNGVENGGFKVVKGTPSTTPQDPALTQEDTFSSGTVYQHPHYRVRLNGVNVEGIDDLREYIPAVNNHNHDEYAQKDAVDSMFIALEDELGNKAPKTHNHDDRYFTEAEINALLGTQVTYTLDGTTLTITTK